MLCNQISKIESLNNNSIAIVVSNKNKTEEKKINKNVKDIKFVKKPWGYEVWFIFKELDFAFLKRYLSRKVLRPVFNIIGIKKR